MLAYGEPALAPLHARLEDVVDAGSAPACAETPQFAIPSDLSIRKTLNGLLGNLPRILRHASPIRWQPIGNHIIAQWRVVGAGLSDNREAFLY